MLKGTPAEGNKSFQGQRTRLSQGFHLLEIKGWKPSWRKQRSKRWLAFFQPCARLRTYLTCSSESSVQSISPSLHNLPSGSSGLWRFPILDIENNKWQANESLIVIQPRDGGRVRTTLSWQMLVRVVADAYRQGCVRMNQWWFGVITTKFVSHVANIGPATSGVNELRFERWTLTKPSKLWSSMTFILIPTRGFYLQIYPQHYEHHRHTARTRLGIQRWHDREQSKPWRIITTYSLWKWSCLHGRLQIWTGLWSRHFPNHEAGPFFCNYFDGGSS